MNNILILLLIVNSTIFAQEKYITKSGNINFEASVPSFEEVAAKNGSVTVILNSENGEIAALALIKAFRFKNALMEEHFNENYAESNKYPKATFKGTIEDFSLDELSSGSKSFKVSGELEFHGQSTEYDDIEIQILRSGDEIKITGNFVANVEDFDIEIPSVVSNKVSEEVNVSLNFELKKK